MKGQCRRGTEHICKPDSPGRAGRERNRRVRGESEMGMEGGGGRVHVNFTFPGLPPHKGGEGKGSGGKELAPTPPPPCTFDKDGGEHSAPLVVGCRSCADSVHPSLWYLRSFIPLPFPNCAEGPREEEKRDGGGRGRGISFQSPGAGRTRKGVGPQVTLSAGYFQVCPGIRGKSGG